VRSEQVEYYSQGELVRADWRTPDDAGPVPAIIQGPGWYGLKDAKAYERYHDAFTAAGFGVLSIDYRGFGASEGERGQLSASGQLEDLLNGVTYLTTRDDVLPETIGAFATGGTGGGNVVLLAGHDARVRAVVSQFPVADGRHWLQRMRPEHEWLAYLHDLEDDRRRRVLTGESRRIHPREEIMVQTPERRTSGFKADVDRRIEMSVPMAAVEEILRYRPVDGARGLTTPVMLIGVEEDATTPIDHAEAIYDVLAGPRKLLVQRKTTHYAAYETYADRVIPEIVDWFRRHLHAPGDIVVVEDHAAYPDKGRNR
jgi:uncharacterized protein